MSKRVKKTSTGLYFDSFKHFKNNISNLISIELLALYNSNDLHEYLSKKPVNVKSKLPDMKKIGLVNYDKPKDNYYGLSEEAQRIYSVMKDKYDIFKYPDDHSERIRAVKPNEIIENLSDQEFKVVQYNLIKLLLSYFDTADFLSPYMVLIKLIEKNNLRTLDNNTLRNILAQPKINVLNGIIRKDEYKALENEIKHELKRPISYINNFLKTSGIIDEHGSIIYDRNIIKKITLELDEINIESIIDFYDEKPSTKTTRSVKLQKQFREDVLSNYDYKCAITGDPIIIKREYLGNLIILEAAHLVPYSEGGSFSYKNGISLSPELHKLFDLGLFVFEYVDENSLKVVVNKKENIKDNGILKSIDNKIINLSKLKKGNPDKIAIEYRKLD